MGEEDARRIDAEGRQAAREDRARVARVLAAREHDDSAPGGPGASRRRAFPREREREGGGRRTMAPVRDAQFENPAFDQRERRAPLRGGRLRDRREGADLRLQARERGAAGDGRQRRPAAPALLVSPMARADDLHRGILKTSPDHPGNR